MIMFLPLSAATKVLIAPVVILLVIVLGALALVIGNIIMNKCFYYYLIFDGKDK